MSPLDSPIASVFGIQYEDLLLACMLKVPNFQAAYGTYLNADVFDGTGNRCIREAHIALYTAGNRAVTTRMLNIHLITERKRTRQSSERYSVLTLALKRLKEIHKRKITGDEVQYVEGKLTEFLQRQNIIAVLLASEVYVNKGDYDGLIAALRDATQVNANAGSNGNLTKRLGMNFAMPKLRLQQYVTRKKIGTHITTGIPILDTLTNGGLASGTLTLIMAPTGRGKTMMLINTAAACMHAGKRVVHITLEISAQVTAMRYDARLIGIPINDIFRNPLRYRKQIMQTANAITAKGGGLIIKEWGSAEAGLRDIELYLELLNAESKYKPDVLIVDYADLICPKGLRQASRAENDKRFALAEITTRLRQMAKDLDCAVVSATQTNRKGYAATIVDLDTVAESIDKVNIADLVIGLCQTKIERDKQLMRLVLSKNRLGGREGMIIDCDVNTATQTITQRKKQMAHRIEDTE